MYSGSASPSVASRGQRSKNTTTESRRDRKGLIGFARKQKSKAGGEGRGGEGSGENRRGVLHWRRRAAVAAVTVERGGGGGGCWSWKGKSESTRSELREWWCGVVWVAKTEPESRGEMNMNIWYDIDISHNIIVILSLNLSTTQIVFYLIFMW